MTGVPLEPQQAYVVEILGDLVTVDSRVRRAVRTGRPARQGRRGDASARARRRARTARPQRAPSRSIPARSLRAIVGWLTDRGGMLTAEDLATYRVIEREPVRASYRGHEVVTNPPPSAGGILIAHALSLLGRRNSPPTVADILAVMEATQAERTSEFLEGLDDPGFTERFLAAGGMSGSDRGPGLGGPSGTPRFDDAHRGHRPRRPGVLGDDEQRRELRVVVPGDGRASQQHARRAGPQPARLSPASARPSAAEHDGADRVLRDGRAGDRAWERRLQPDPLGDHCRRSCGSSTTGCASGEAVAGARGSTTRMASSTPSRGSTCRRSGRRRTA